MGIECETANTIYKEKRFVVKKRAMEELAIQWCGGKGKEMVSGQVWDAKSLFAVIGLGSAKGRSRGEI